MTGFHSKVIYFFTNCFFVILSLSRVGRYICLVKGKNGIQPFPASGSPTAGFSPALKCERRQRVAALPYPNIFPPKQKDACKGVLLFWRERREFIRTQIFIVIKRKSAPQNTDKKTKNAVTEKQR